MRKALFALVLMAVVATAGPAWAARSVLPPEVPKVGTATNLPVVWQNNLKDALALAGTQYQPVMVLFSSPDCQWCTRLKEDVLTDPGVSDMLQHYVLVEIDVTQDANSAELYQVRGVPTVLILSADGEVKTGIGGYVAAPEFQKLLRGGLNPEFLKRKEVAYLDLLKMLEDNAVASNRWADIMIELGSPDRRKDLHTRIFNLTPFPKKEIFDLLKDPRLAVRLGALEIVEEISGGISGYDPWWDETAAESNKVALARLRTWAGVTNEQPTGAVASVYSALTREQVSSYIRDLMAEDRDRSIRALRMLQHGGPNVFTVLTEFLQANPDLPAGRRNRIKEVQYMLAIEGCGNLNASAVAHRLLLGNLDVRLKAIGDLRGAGVNAIPILKEFLLDRDPIVRETAADTLLIAGAARAIPLLKEHLVEEKDKDVIFCILNGLGKVRNRTGLDILTSYLNHPNEDLVVASLNSIAKLKSAAAHREVAHCLSDPRWRVRVAALEGVGALKLSNLDAAVTDMLKDKDPFVRYTAIKALTSISAKKAAPKLEDAFLREDELKGPIVAAYGSMDIPLPASFAKAMDGKGPDVVLAVIEALKDCGEKDLQLAERYLDDGNLDLACAATRLIATKGMKNSKYRARIVAVLQKGKRELVLAVLESLRFDDRTMLKGLSGAMAARLAGMTGTDVPVVLTEGPSDGTLDALFGAFMEGMADPAKPAPAKPEKTPAAAPAATNDAPAVANAAEDDIFAAFMESAVEPGTQQVAGAGTQPVAGATATTGTAVRVEMGSTAEDVVRAVEATMEGSSDDGIRFRAALLLTQLGSAKGLPVLGSGLASRTQADRMAAAENLSGATGKEALPLLQLLLQDPSEEVRGEAASMCLMKTAGTAFLEAVLNDLARPDTRLKPYDVPLSSFETVARQTAGRRVAGDWARRVLAESKDLTLRNFALVVLESCWKSTDTQLVTKWIRSDDPLQRRAALHALGKGDAKAFTNEIGWVSEDPSELVRAVIPNLYMRDSSRWLDYLDSTHFKSERYSYGNSYDSYGNVTKLPRPVRDALNKMTEDDSPKIRVEAYFCLLSNIEKIDLMKFLKTVESFPDQQAIGERVADYLAHNYEKLGPGFRVLIPYLEQSRRDDSYLDKVRKHFKIDPNKVQESFAVITRGGETAPLEATYLDVAPAAGKTVHKLVYFSTPGCQDCERVQRLFPALRQDFPDLAIETFNIRKLNAMNLNEALCETFRVPEGSRLVAPAMFAGGGYLIKRDVTDAGLHELVIRSERIPLKDWYEMPPETLAKAETAIARRYSAMGLGVVAVAGLLDGINPCAFATIIFLLSYLQIARREPRQILQIGAAFILGVFLAYLVMGLGLIGIVAKAQKALSGVRLALNWGLAAFSLIIMILSIRDGVLCLRGRLQDITLQLPGMLKEGIHGVIRRGSRHAHFVIATFVVGVAISVLELACTGQVYLPTIGYMLEKGQNTGGAIGYLFLYNVMFIAPLVAIFAIASFGLTSEALTRFLQKHAASVKFSTAALFLLLFLFFLFGSLVPLR